MIDNIKNDVWSIVNHNDALSNEEINNLSDKTDNDKNTIHISDVLENTNYNVRRVIYLTNTDGLLDENKNTVSGGKIESENDKNYFRGFVKEDKSSSGTGGMISKLDCSFEVLKYGVKESIIANAKNGLNCLKKNYENVTRFSK